ncbi:hypothetical protein DM02DRAFT_626154 [Periconia macrospinosa]|uniref:Uncharacterized protein n=1 Tax=Periconia macrospinosa TaxID=97972 RepID=A0A2V1DXL8_9PLEO|nr:hypothetical protein DM02DRAFT_626154 [Periconia macrospinosa]
MSSKGKGAESSGKAEEACYTNEVSQSKSPWDKLAAELRMQVVRNTFTIRNLALLSADYQASNKGVMVFLVEVPEHGILSVDKKTRMQALAELNTTPPPPAIIVPENTEFEATDTALLLLGRTRWAMVFQVLHQFYTIELNHYQEFQNLADVKTILKEDASMSTCHWIPALQSPEDEYFGHMCLRVADYLRWVSTKKEDRESFTLLNICMTTPVATLNLLDNRGWKREEWERLFLGLSEKFGLKPKIIIYVRDPGKFEYELDQKVLDHMEAKYREFVKDNKEHNVFFGGIVTREDWENKWAVAEGWKI